MENNAQKNDWIEAVMGSTQGMRRAAPRDDIYEAVRSRLGAGAPVKTVSLPVARWAAAALLLLVLNIGSAVYYMNYSRKAHTENTEKTFAAEIQPVSTYNY